MKNKKREMEKAVVIMNQSHSLKDDQKRLLEETFNEIEFIKSPKGGWDLNEINEVSKKIHYSLTGEETNMLSEKTNNAVVFVSPIPALLKRCIQNSIQPLDYMNTYKIYKVLVFHNDRRHKKELPSGKIISIPAEEGWELV